MLSRLHLVWHWDTRWMFYFPLSRAIRFVKQFTFLSLSHSLSLKDRLPFIQTLGSWECTESGQWRAQRVTLNRGIFSTVTLFLHSHATHHCYPPSRHSPCNSLSLCLTVCQCATIATCSSPIDTCCPSHCAIVGESEWASELTHHLMNQWQYLV